MNHDSKSEIRAMLEERGLSLKKRWGQNFLVNRGARERLVSLLGVQPGESSWEIGPGLGSMTELLSHAAGELTVFEIDRGLCRWLEECYGGRPGFRLVQGDFLETWREARDRQGLPDRILGNLPYRSASIMIASMVEGELRPRSMVLTVQRELGDRMTARPGEKSYSSFTVLCQACHVVENRGDLKPGSFYPVPEVVSTIVELRPRAGRRHAGRSLGPGARAFLLPTEDAQEQHQRPVGREQGRRSSCRIGRACGPGEGGNRWKHAGGTASAGCLCGDGAGPYAIRSSLSVAASASRFFSAMAHMGRR